MKSVWILLIAGAATVSVVTAATAADQLVDPIEMATGFSWDGPYVGLQGSAGIVPAVALVAGVELLVGFGATADQVYYGAEISGGLPGFGQAWGQIDARLGFLATDDLLVFGLGGFGMLTGAGGAIPFGVLGVGAEFSVTEQMSVRGQYQLNLSPTFVGPVHLAKVGLSWYF